ncbi:hypothetical protein [Sphingobacterium thalpophilum]|uniref:Uncharacterized protein n=1 Tax=Sphingobacterium thalpophilum TaxID=259 RepID=A0A4U9V5Q3_9SPHI|nr:hypothetical protein [Sphingobacterium thalpophilum]VTR41153.1 Uncharacterised protein [Sphingobacterium thalpophilum]
MELLKIEDLLNSLWQEIELYLSESEELNLQKANSLRKKTNVVIEEAERQLSYTLIELGHNHNGKGHRVDAVMEQAIALSLKADTHLSKAHLYHPYRTELLECFLASLDRLMLNIRSKFSHLQYAKLSPPLHYVGYIQAMEINKVEYIIKTIQEANLHAIIVSSLQDYFVNPMPSNHSSRTPNDGFSSLDYFVGLVESLYEICRKTSTFELEEAIYYELINRNFNRVQFIRALVSYYRKILDKVEDPIDEIGRLFVMQKEISKIPVISGMAYIHSDAGLKEFVLRAISIEIRFLKNMIKHREQEVAYLIGPTFSTQRNIVQFLMMFNALFNLSFLRRTGKGSLPQFIRQNFIRANGETFSLGSLQKKNSVTDRKNAQGLVEMLSKMIEYITRNYL